MTNAPVTKQSISFAVGAALSTCMAPLLLTPAAQAQDQLPTSVEEQAAFDFTPLGLNDLTLAQADQPEPGTDNVPVTVTEGESKAKEDALQDYESSIASLGVNSEASFAI